MIEIINLKFTNVKIKIESEEFRRLLRAADLFNTETQEKIEAKTFAEIIDGGQFSGLAETQLLNHLGDWQFCIDRHKQIKRLEEELQLCPKSS